MIIDIDLETDKLSTNIYSCNDILFNCIKQTLSKTNKPIGVFLPGFKLCYRALSPTVNHYVDEI